MTTRAPNSNHVNDQALKEPLKQSHDPHVCREPSASCAHYVRALEEHVEHLTRQNERLVGECRTVAADRDAERELRRDLQMKYGPE